MYTTYPQEGPEMVYLAKGTKILPCISEYEYNELCEWIRQNPGITISINLERR